MMTPRLIVEVEDKAAGIHRDVTDYVQDCRTPKRSRGGGVGISFTVNDPDGDLAGLFNKWDDVRVWQGWQPAGELTNRAKLRYTRGVIQKAPRRSDNPAVTYTVEGDAYTSVLSNYRANRQWENKRPDEIVVEAMTSFGPPFIGTGLVQQNTAVLEIHKAKWRPLSELLDDMRKLTGWAGWIDDDLQLRWENPGAIAAELELSPAAGNIVGGTASFEQEGPTVNDVLVFGGLVRTDNYTDDYHTGDANKVVFPLAYHPRNITVTADGAPLTVGTEGLHQFAEGYACLFNYKQKVLKFPAPRPGQVIHARYQYDYPVNARYRDTASIAKYGVLQNVVIDTAIQDKRAALERARAAVRAGAWPKWVGSLRVSGPAIMAGRTSWPLQPGRMVRVDIPRLGVAADMEIEEETFVSANQTLRVELRLRQP